MIEFNRNYHLVPQNNSDIRIKIVGVGGAGANALDRMVLDGASGADCSIMNTDVQALTGSVTSDKIQLGRDATRGLGTGGDPELGQAAAEEAIDEIRQVLSGGDIVFLCAGLGGGTGSGASPVIASIARDMGMLVIAVVTMPFAFEGKRRLRQAEEALITLQAAADAVICFENDTMGDAVSPRAGIHQAFAAADETISGCVRAVSKIFTRPGILHIGFDDLAAALRSADGGAGRCLFGFGEAEGDNRVHEALARALKNPLMDRGRMLGDSHNVLVNVSGGPDMTLNEVDILMQEIGRHLGDDTQVLFGTCVDPRMGETLSVTLISSVAIGTAQKHGAQSTARVHSHAQADVHAAAQMRMQPDTAATSAPKPNAPSGTVPTDMFAAPPTAAVTPVATVAAVPAMPSPAKPEPAEQAHVGSAAAAAKPTAPAVSRASNDLAPLERTDEEVRVSGSLDIPAEYEMRESELSVELRKSPAARMDFSFEDDERDADVREKAGELEDDLNERDGASENRRGVAVNSDSETTGAEADADSEADETESMKEEITLEASGIRPMVVPEASAPAQAPASAPSVPAEPARDSIATPMPATREPVSAPIRVYAPTHAQASSPATAPVSEPSSLIAVPPSATEPAPVPTPRPQRTIYAPAASSHPAPAGTPAASPKREERQETLQFEPIARGRFEKGPPTIEDGQDLDVPTFLRRNVRVR